jgi:hypothetical protein
MPVLPRAYPWGWHTRQVTAFAGKRALGRLTVAQSIRYNVGAAVTGITGTDSTDTFTKTSHGFTNGANVVGSGLTGGSALAPLLLGGLFVINAAANTFQLARVPNGAAVDLGSDVTALTLQRIVSGVPVP